MNHRIIEIATYLILLILAMIPTSGFSQADSLQKEYQKEFDEFSKSIQQDFDLFQKQNDSIFLEFLSQSWKSFEAFKSQSAMKPKPKEQPKREKTDLHLQPIKPGIIRTPEDKPIMERKEIEESGFIEPMMNPSGMPTKKLDFYGTSVVIYPSHENLPRLRQVSPLYFVEFFQEAAKSTVLAENIRSLQRQAGELELNDWGLICLLHTAAQELFKEPNEQILFVWFGMIRCGFDVKTGYDNSRVYLLVPSRQDLYNTVYFSIKNKLYFLLKLNTEVIDIEKLNAYEADYPGNEQPISLIINKLPEFLPVKESREINYKKEMLFEVDKNLVDFFSTYPDCDLIVSFMTPLSGTALKSLKRALEPELSGLSEEEKVAYLLKLIQYGFPYKIDEDQFGRENYLFPEETLFYPHSDCEDRTVLLARLVEHFTVLKTIALCYPDHVTLAVNLPGEMKGAYVEYKGLMYTVCDPTYIGAEIGMVMKEYVNVKPEIIAY